jgi:diguanylate cyclase (GGDEF)-like protein
MTTMTDGRRAAGTLRLRLDPAQRAWVWTVTVAAAATALFVIVVRPLPQPVDALTLPWVVWALAFAVSEVLVVHVHMERDSHTFSLSDLVLAAGLCLAPPSVVVSAHVVGTALSLVVHRRQRGVKLAFNVAQFALAGCVATTVCTALADTAPGVGPRDWLAALAGVLMCTVTADLCIFTVIALSRGRADVGELRSMLLLSLPFTLGSAAGGLVVARTAVDDPVATVLMSLPMALVILAYRAYTRAREQQGNLRVLHEVTSLLHQTGDPTDALTDFLTSVRGAFRAQAAELVLFGDGTDDPTTVSRSQDGAAPLVLAPHADAEDAHQLARAAMRSGVLTARTRSRGDGPLDRYAAERGLHDAMVSVLRTEDRVHGLFVVSDRLGDVARFTEADLALLETFAGHVATSLERGRLQEDLRQVTDLKEQLRHQALHDSLTGLPNRALFLDRARHAVVSAARSGAWPALLYLDLDGFKPVNDTYGHEAGDQLLRTVATRLGTCLRDGDTAARLGGDEFAVLLEGPLSGEAVQEVVDRIQAALNVPVDLGDGRIATVRVSIGVAVGDAGTDDADALIHQADTAMYLAKRGGGNASRQYGPGYEDSAESVEVRAEQLADAVANGEMAVVYQPLVDLRTGRPTGAEALVRWDHPDGTRMPDSFIGLAEETGLIVDIGAQVLREACHQAARWTAARPDAPGLMVTVNLSARQLSAPGIVEEVRSALDSAGLAPGRLVLEITETVLMHDRDAAAATLWELKALGVRIAVDDFGTGYSSLAYLRRFPIDILKVAREFICGLGQDAQDDVITRAIVDLADTLGLLTVAEGIETQEQYEFVTALQCDLAQGYLFARPVSAEVAHAIVTGAESSLPAAADPTVSTPAIGPSAGLVRAG